MISCLALFVCHYPLQMHVYVWKHMETSSPAEFNINKLVRPHVAGFYCDKAEPWCLHP